MARPIHPALADTFQGLQRFDPIPGCPSHLLPFYRRHGPISRHTRRSVQYPRRRTHPLDPLQSLGISALQWRIRPGRDLDKWLFRPLQTIPGYDSQISRCMRHHRRESQGGSIYHHISHLFLIDCRQTASTAPVDSPVSYPKGTLYWSKSLCMQRVQLVDSPINATNPSPFQSGNDKTGPTTPKVACIALSLATGVLILCRHLAIPFQRSSSHVDNVWLHESDIAVCESRHRTFLCHDHVLKGIAANPA